jgi:acyl-coenzyme A synthetase/AMP-(fatty) acid ligase
MSRSVLESKRNNLNPEPLYKTIEKLAENEYSDKCALLYHDEHDNKRYVTYKEMNSTSNQIASSILQIIGDNNLKPNVDGDWIVCTCMRPSDKYITTILAILKCGGMKLSF